MHIDWLHRNNQRQCILFFSGWGMDPDAVSFSPRCQP